MNIQLKYMRNYTTENVLYVCMRKRTSLTNNCSTDTLKPTPISSPTLHLSAIIASTVAFIANSSRTMQRTQQNHLYRKLRGTGESDTPKIP